MNSFIRDQILNSRRGLILSATLLQIWFGYTLAYLLRFDFEVREVTSRSYLFPLALLLFLRFGAYIYWRLNRGYWRYTSANDFETLFKAHLASSMSFAAALLLFRVENFPRSVLFIEFAISLLLSGGCRFFVRLVCERYLRPDAAFRPARAREVIVLGAGDSGHLLVKNLVGQRRLSYKPVAVLDDSEHKIGTAVFGVRVLGSLSELANVLDDHQRACAVILAIPSLSPRRIDELEAVCRSFDVPLKRLQAFEDLACIDGAQAPDSLSVEAVLEREIDVEHEDEVRDAVRSRRVLVSGAGGSIGSELVRQLLQFSPARLTLLDNSEYHLFRITNEIAGRSPEVQRSAVLASISDERRIERVLAEEAPDIVFHAAAYKHVPLLEANCYEAFVNNVVGTRNLLRASLGAGVKRFVMISTDKAVDPSSVMGCSKRIAELLVQNYHELALDQRGKAESLQTAVVRFGNVINSNGSVVPLFRDQILSGGPLTVTHPEMERYFMSIREAVRLVLTAGTLGERGEIYILDMGKPIRIVDVARKMLALYGRRDIPIVFTGLRPGEKLSEVLTAVGEVKSATRFRKVRKVINLAAPRFDARAWVNAVEMKLEGLSDTELGALMHSCVMDVETRAKEAMTKRGVAEPLAS